MQNVTLGRKVLNHIEAHREQFDVKKWGRPDPACGTVACIAGHTVLMSGYRLQGPGEWKRPDGTVICGSVAYDAARLLGLSDREWHWSPGEDRCGLFSGSQTDDEAIERFKAIVEAAEQARTRFAELQELADDPDWLGI
jgi:hypothetical protein